MPRPKAEPCTPRAAFLRRCRSTQTRPQRRQRTTMPHCQQLTRGPLPIYDARAASSSIEGQYAETALRESTSRCPTSRAVAHCTYVLLVVTMGGLPACAWCVLRDATGLRPNQRWLRMQTHASSVRLAAFKGLAALLSVGHVRRASTRPARVRRNVFCVRRASTTNSMSRVPADASAVRRNGVNRSRANRHVSPAPHQLIHRHRRHHLRPHPNAVNPDFVRCTRRRWLTRMHQH